MTYQSLAEFAQTWGLVLFVAAVAAVVAFAVWPGNKRRFDEAARIPLNEDEILPPGGRNG